MSTAGIQYAFTRFGGSADRIRVLYDFGISGDISNCSNVHSGQYSGVLSGSAAPFWATSGVGSFSNHAIVPQEATGLPLTNFCFLAWGNKPPSNSEQSLVSSLASGLSGIASGFSVYVTETQRLAFRFSTCSGRQSWASHYAVLGPYAVGVSHFDGKLDFYTYDNFNNETQSTSLTIPYEDLFPSDQWTFGNGENLPYSGNFSNLLLASGGIDAAYAGTLFSGAGDIVQTVVTPAITGNECTGISVPSTTSILVTPVAAVPYSVVKREAILITSQTLIPTDEIVLDFCPSGFASFNNTAIVNHTRGTFVMSRSEASPIAFFMNGQRHIESGSQITGQFCFRGRKYLMDYQLSGRNVNSAWGLDKVDVGVYDNRTDNSVFQYAISSGTGSVSIPPSGLTFYLNGVRTDEYSISGGQFYPPSWLTNEDQWVIDYHSDKVTLNYSGSGAYFQVSGGYIAGTSRLYMNGQRLTLGRDYLEVLSGEFNTPTTGSINYVLAFETQILDATYD